MADNNQGAGDSQDLNIHIDKEKAEGTYSNLVMIAHSPEEFILDFIRVVPGVQKARVKERLIITPQHAKRLLKALKKNIDRYEDSHGKIKPSKRPNRRIQFGGPDAKA